MQKYLLGIVVIGVAFGAGYFARDLSQDSLSTVEPSNLATPQHSQHSNSPLKSVVANEELKGLSPVASSKVAHQATPEISLDEVTKRISQINAFGPRSMSFSDTAALYNMIDSLEQDELLRVMDEFASDPELKESNALFVLLKKYAELSPKGALAYAQNNIAAEQFKDSAVMYVMSFYARNNPLGALEEYEQMIRSFQLTGSSNLRNSILVSVFSGLAENDKALAIDKLMGSELSGQSMTMALIGLTTQLSDKQDYLDLLGRIDEAENNNELANSVMSSWARRNPQQAAEWLENDYSGDQYNSIRETVYSSWSSKEPEKSAEWMLNSASEQNLNSTVRNIISYWGMRDPESTLKWMSRQSDKVYNQRTFKNLLQSAAYSNPTFVDQNLAMINSEKERANLASQVYQTLKRQSVKKAQEYLEQSPYKEGIKKDEAKINAYRERG